jgi:hypothetical protein
VGNEWLPGLIDWFLDKRHTLNGLQEIFRRYSNLYEICRIAYQNLDYCKHENFPETEMSQAIWDRLIAWLIKEGHAVAKELPWTTPGQKCVMPARETALRLPRADVIRHLEKSLWAQPEAVPAAEQQPQPATPTAPMTESAVILNQSMSNSIAEHPSEASGNATEEGKVSDTPPEQSTKARSIQKSRDESKTLLLATLDLLTKEKKWGYRNRQIYEKARISKAVYYRLKKDDPTARERIRKYWRESRVDLERHAQKPGAA